MSVKPIDLQTSMNQLIEVGRNEHAKSAAVADQQHVRENEANEKSRLINTRLDDAKKGEKTSIRDEEEKKRGSGDKHRSGNRDDKESESGGLKDDRAGRLIDFRS